MTPSEIQGYFADKLSSLGLSETKSSFAQNVPAGLTDLTYAFEMGSAVIQPANQLASRFLMPVTILIYFKDYRTQTDLRSVALKKMEQIFKLLLSTGRSLGNAGFAIQPSNVSIDPVGSSNLACAVMRIGFDVSMYLNFRGL